LRKR
jgi:nucleotide-binding universal stress UspA family protein/hemerythrin-like domain-containing protein